MPSDMGVTRLKTFGKGGWGGHGQNRPRALEALVYEGAERFFRSNLYTPISATLICL